MAKLVWDKIEDRTYETGVDHGVLYEPDEGGAYTSGVPWNGLVSVTESPSGAEPNAQYADNMKYLNLISAEEFAATLECITYPKEFEKYDGIAAPTPGVSIGQQRRGTFGLSYRSKKGNALQGDDFGVKIHLVFGCTAAPSEKAYTTVNDSPEPINFSYELATTPVGVSGLRPTSIVTIDSTVVDPTAFAALEDLLYGTPGQEPRLPLPDELVALFSGSQTPVPMLVMPAYNAGTHTITIPTTTGVTYYVDGEAVAAGDLVITEDTVVEARANEGYVLNENSDDDWSYDFV